MHMCPPESCEKEDYSYDVSSEYAICCVDTDKLNLSNTKRPIMQVHFRKNKVYYCYYAKAEFYKLREPCVLI